MEARLVIELSKILPSGRKVCIYVSKLLGVLFRVYIGKMCLDFLAE